MQLLIAVWTESIGNYMKINEKITKEGCLGDFFYVKENLNKEEKEAAYKMAGMQGVGNKSIFKLLNYAGSTKDALNMSEKEIYDVLDARAAKAFLQGRENLDCNTTEWLKKEKGIDFVPFISANYPSRLRNIPDPPFALYVKGKLPTETKPSVAIIGARACSEYGKTVAEHFGRGLGNAGIQIVSGMARGIDGIAQWGAIESNGESFAVLGCGVDVCYPKENNNLYIKLQKKGGIISEYVPGTKPESKLFPPRNRIISGLADLILVIEARKRSGTYITVLQALEQGKEVYAVPGRVTDSLSDGCNFLLSQGAGVAISTDCIIEELSHQYALGLEKNKSTELSMRDIEEEDKERESIIILSALEINPIALEELHYRIKDKIQMDMAHLVLILTKLQISGKVIGVGDYYRLANAL